MLKEKLLICLLLCFGLCFTSSCNKNISSTLLTEDISTDLPDQSIDEVFIQSSTSNQSELPVHSGDDKMVNNCKLVVRGEDITCGNYVKLNENYAELPFTAVMKALGAEVEWQSETTAKLTFCDKDYILDTEKVSFIEVGGRLNVIIPPPGATRHYQVYENEFILDNVTMNSAFHLMDISIRININYNDKIIYISE